MNIIEQYAAAAFSRTLCEYTFHYYCKKYQQDRFARKPSKYYEYSNQTVWLMHNVKFANDDFIIEEENIRMDINVKKSNPDYWLKEYKSYIECKRKLGRVPDTGMFVMPKELYNRLSYNEEIKDLINREDVIIG
jgi:hypothetical protein